MRDRRLAVVREHMEAENQLDFDTVIGTFGHPRYELMASGQTFDGEEEVRQYFAQSRATFPDQRNENVVLHHTDDGVIVEFDLLGTHQGPLAGMAPTGRAFRCRMVALFLFGDDGRINCERVYFDSGTILRQLGLLGDRSSQPPT